MSVSSGSDVTIPMQDSPPPPPSPYANGNNKIAANAKNAKMAFLSGESPTGIENKAYSPTGSEVKGSGGGASSPSGSTSKKGQTEIDLEGNSPAEAVNSEVINMSILGTIPGKPQSEFGPYEQMDDYFIPVNQHKKFLR
jgi:hypothetical protein